MTAAASIRRWEQYVWPLCTAAAALLLWSGAVRWSGTTVFPSPLDVERAFGELLGKGLLWGYTGDSLFRVGVGYSAAAGTYEQRLRLGGV